MSKSAKSNIMLFLTAIIWGSSFIAQSKGADLLGPFTFNAVRYFFAVVSMLPVIYFLRRKNLSETPKDMDKKSSLKALVLGGISLGVVLFVSTSLQQYAMAFTTAAKAGFITTLYVILVPIVSLFFGKKVRPLLWICAILAVAGLYLLSIKPGTFSIDKGDFFVLLCALGFTLHILLIDYFAPKTDGSILSCVQFAVVAILSFIAMLGFETFVLQDVLSAMAPILYAGVLSSSVGYTFQIIAQKDAEPTIASLILSLESVFAAICGALFLGELLNMREIFGCIIMFIAIILAQLPSKEKL